MLSAESGCPLCKAFVCYLHLARAAVDSCWATFVNFGEDDLQPHAIGIQKKGENESWPHSRALVLLSTTCYSDPGQGHLRPSSQVYRSSSSPVQLALPVLPRSTKDQRCMVQASAWFRKCLENHKRCNQLSDVCTVQTMPSRLLEVSPKRVKIVATAYGSDSKAPVYMTLSHRWQNRMPKLLQCNIKKMEMGIDVFEFPQMFQDTFILARKLQIPYVWIDALCIIQDNEVEKASEISKMDHIYQNAVLNICATGAADAAGSSPDTVLTPHDEVKGVIRTEMRGDSNSDCRTEVTNDWRLKDEDGTNAENYDWFASKHSSTSPHLDLQGFAMGHIQPEILRPGLFGDRDPLIFSPFAVTIKREGKEYSRIIHNWKHTYDFENSALFKRGWVLQERLLSPRTLFFGQQIFWECSELVACETFPFGFPWHLAQPNVRLGRILTEGNESSKQSAQYKAWLNIVKSFTKCQLTYDLDCFPALSGLAHNFQASLHDEYYAGLWKGDFISGLCWFREEQDFGQYPPYPKDYRGELAVHRPAFAPPLIPSAPSWSWASVKFAVVFLSSNKSYTCIGRIEEIDVTPSGSDPLGRISSARLQISGHLRKAIRRVSERNIRRMASRTVDIQGVQYEWFDTGHEGEDFHIRDMSTAYFLLLAHQEGAMVAGTGDELVLIERFIGIIIEPIDDDKTTWRRIGAFRHPRGDGWMEQDYSPGYPEFYDWDPKNYERHTITII